jgi:cytochrome c oxidase subunit II
MAMVRRPAPRGTMSSVHRLTTRVVPIVVATLLLAACASDAPQDTFKPEGSQARKISSLDFVFYLAFGVAALVGLVVVYVLFRFRASKYSKDDVPTQLHGNTKAEIGWTLLPAVILAGVAVPTVAVLFDIADRPDDAIRIDAIGQQWWWEFSYPGLDIATSGEMVFPAGQKIVVNITSRDVIHSFWFPRLNGKRDAVPGRIHTLTIEADEPGEFEGQCTEFCGLSHANMRMRAIALAPDDWEAWVAGQQSPAPTPEEGSAAAAGQTAFNARCSSCHVIEGGGATISEEPASQIAQAAPNLTWLMGRTTFAGAIFQLQTPECRDEREAASDAGDMSAYLGGTTDDCLNRTQLEAWLRNSPAEKPMYPPLRGMPAQGLTEQEIDDLVAYLLTLNPATASGGN